LVTQVLAAGAARRGDALGPDDVRRFGIERWRRREAFEAAVLRLARIAHLGFEIRVAQARGGFRLHIADWLVAHDGGPCARRADVFAVAGEQAVDLATRRLLVSALQIRARL